MAAANASLGDLRTWTHHVVRWISVHCAPPSFTPFIAEAGVWTQEKSIWKLWWTQWHWDRFLSRVLLISCRYNSTSAPLYNISNWRHWIKLFLLPSLPPPPANFSKSLRSWGFQTGQKIPGILWNSEFRYSCHKRPPLVLGDMNSTDANPFCCFKIRPHYIFLSTPRTSRPYKSYRFILYSFLFFPIPITCLANLVILDLVTPMMQSNPVITTSVYATPRP